MEAMQTGRDFLHASPVSAVERPQWKRPEERRLWRPQLAKGLKRQKEQCRFADS
jgi:hypothetical protein